MRACAASSYRNNARQTHSDRAAQEVHRCGSRRGTGPRRMYHPSRRAGSQLRSTCGRPPNLYGCVRCEPNVAASLEVGSGASADRRQDLLSGADRRGYGDDIIDHCPADSRGGGLRQYVSVGAFRPAVLPLGGQISDGASSRW
ncbi:hypothetical protein FRAHR75_610037 [Frankia sp. Hr75.2]|nr:hypothetical protein FRAHR75_610037 [Frankia sp. Hr75.2]